jgi:hypothetical protein
VRGMVCVGWGGPGAAPARARPPPPGCGQVDDTVVRPQTKYLQGLEKFYSLFYRYAGCMILLGH